MALYDSEHLSAEGEIVLSKRVAEGMGRTANNGMNLTRNSAAIFAGDPRCYTLKWTYRKGLHWSPFSGVADYFLSHDPKG
jgi:hypothetical protein